MGRTYAGILGCLAMTLALVRGAWAGSGADETLTRALIVLVLFTVIGFVLGQIAEATVDEAVRARLERELAHNHAPSPSRPADLAA